VFFGLYFHPAMEDEYSQGISRIIGIYLWHPAVGRKGQRNETLNFARDYRPGLRAGFDRL
jgi:hypothetical protein